MVAATALGPIHPVNSNGLLKLNTTLNAVQMVAATFEGSYKMYASGSNIKMTYGVLSKDNTTSALTISGGSSGSDGARLNLYGDSHASSAGKAELICEDLKVRDSSLSYGVKISNQSPTYGVGIESPSGGWVRGYQFMNQAGITLLGGFGAFGSGDVISYWWIGDSYSAPAIQIRPSTRTVGIGHISSPAAMLDIRTTHVSYRGLYIESIAGIAADYVKIVTSTSAPIFYITSAGLCGIGITPTVKLHVATSGTTACVIDGGGGVSDYVTLQMRNLDDNDRFMISKLNSGHASYPDAAYFANTVSASLKTYMVWANTGYVGFNVTPTYMYHFVWNADLGARFVMQNTNAGSSSASLVTAAGAGVLNSISIGYYSPSYASVSLYQDMAVVQAASGTSGLVIDERSGNQILFASGGTENAHLAADGSFGIGVSSAAPRAELDLRDGGRIYIQDVADGDGNARWFNQLVWHYDSPSLTGAVVIKLPTNASTMQRIVIRGYDYVDGRGSWKVTIGGYVYAASPLWLKTGVQIEGAPPFGRDVYVAWEDVAGTPYPRIVLGTVSTVWNYPQIVIDQEIAGFAGQGSWTGDWTAELQTDLSWMTATSQPVQHSFAWDIYGSAAIGIDPVSSVKLYVYSDSTRSGVFAYKTDTGPAAAIKAEISGASTYAFLAYHNGTSRYAQYSYGRHYFGGGNFGFGINLPTSYIHAYLSTNAAVQMLMQNTASDTAATVAFAVSAGGTVGYFTAYSPGFTTSGMAVADSVRLYADATASGGLYLVTGAVAPVVFAVNGSQVGYFDGTTGYLTLGQSAETTTRVLTTASNANALVVTAVNGAKATLYGGSHATLAGRMYLDASLVLFRTVSGVLASFTDNSTGRWAIGPEATSVDPYYAILIRKTSGVCHGVKTYSSSTHAYNQILSADTSSAAQMVFGNGTYQWQLGITNDTTSSFVIYAATSGTTPVYIEAAAPTHSLHIDTTGITSFGATSSSGAQVNVKASGRSGLMVRGGGTGAFGRYVYQPICTALLGSHANGMLIKTKIAFTSGGGMWSIRFRGYSYGSIGNADFAVSFYMYGSPTVAFYNATMSNWGGVVPTVILDVWDDAGTDRVAIHITTPSNSYLGFGVEGYNIQTDNTSAWNDWTSTNEVAPGDARALELTAAYQKVYLSDVIHFNGFGIGVGTATYADSTYGVKCAMKSYFTDDVILAQAAGGNLLNLRGGTGGTGATGEQIRLSYTLSDSYSHRIQTRHASAAVGGNAIDFYVWNQTVDAIASVGTHLAMQVDARGIRVNQSKITAGEPSFGLYISPYQASHGAVWLKGLSGQTGDYLQVQNSLGSNVYRILGNGTISQGLTSTGTSGSIIAHSIVHYVSPSGASSFYGRTTSYSLQIRNDGGYTISTSQYSLVATVQHIGSGAANDTLAAAWIYPYISTTGTQTLAAVYGVLFSGFNLNATCTISSYAAIKINAPSNSGTITNRYGIYCVDTLAANIFAGPYFAIGRTSVGSGVNMDFEGDANCLTYMRNKGGSGDYASIQLLSPGTSNRSSFTKMQASHASFPNATYISNDVSSLTTNYFVLRQDNVVQLYCGGSIASTTSWDTAGVTFDKTYNGDVAITVNNTSAGVLNRAIIKVGADAGLHGYFMVASTTYTPVAAYQDALIITHASGLTNGILIRGGGSSAGITLMGINSTTVRHFEMNSNGEITLTPHAASYTPLLIKAASSQTAYLFEWQNSAGAKLGHIGPSGRMVFGIGTTVVRSADLTVRRDSAGTVATAFAAYNANTTAVSAVSIELAVFNTAQGVRLIQESNAGGGSSWATGNYDAILATGQSTSWLHFAGGGATVPAMSIDSSNTVRVYGGFALGTLSTLTISTGAVTITASRHTIAAETGTTDDLVTINGGTDGEIIVLQPDAGDVITVKDGTGNLYLAGDFAMGSIHDRMVLQYDGSNWFELTRSDNA